MKEITFAGYGGQGVLTGGLALAYIALANDVNVTWMPSYGPEMRGGKSKCVVKFGETPEEIIPVPMMASMDVLVAMNQLALDYTEFCAPGALVLMNADNVPEDQKLPEGLRALRVPCATLAYDCGNPKGTSIVMLGALIAATGLFGREFAKQAMCRMFEEKGKSAANEVNIRAFDAGWDAVAAMEGRHA